MKYVDVLRKQRDKVKAIADACDWEQLQRLLSMVEDWAREGDLSCDHCEGTGVLFDSSAHTQNQGGHPDNREPAEYFSNICDHCNGEGYVLPKF